MHLGNESIPAVPFSIPLTGGGGNNGCGYGGEWMWMMWLWPLYMMLGYGGYGGWGGNGGGQALTRSDLCSEFQFNNLDRAVTGISQGICDSTYALNNTMQNGFHSVENMLATFSGQNAAGQESIKNQSIMNTNSLQQQLNQCCCNFEKAIMANQFAIQQQHCDTLQAIDKLGDRIEARFTAQDLAAKDAQIAAMNQQLFGASLRASQAEQTDRLVDILRPLPRPMYMSCNPWAAQAPYGSCYSYANGVCA